MTHTPTSPMTAEEKAEKYASSRWDVSNRRHLPPREDCVKDYLAGYAEGFREGVEALRKIVDSCTSDECDWRGHLPSAEAILALLEPKEGGG